MGRHMFHVIQGFHPAKIQYEEGIKGDKLNRTLCNIFLLTFKPCGEWRTRYQQKLEEDLRFAANHVHRATWDYLNLMVIYGQVRHSKNMALLLEKSMLEALERILQLPKDMEPTRTANTVFDLD
jgi:hypothetical protein